MIDYLYTLTELKFILTSYIVSHWRIILKNACNDRHRHLFSFIYHSWHYSSFPSKTLFSTSTLAVLLLLFFCFLIYPGIVCSLVIWANHCSLKLNACFIRTLLWRLMQNYLWSLFLYGNNPSQTHLQSCVWHPTQHQYSLLKSVSFKIYKM